MNAKAPRARPGELPVGRDRQRQIFAAASRLFMEKGFVGASMSDIAEAVQLTKPGLYHFVDSKEDLLFTIVACGMDRLAVDVIEPALEQTDPLTRLKMLVRNHALIVGEVATDIGSPLSRVVDDTSGLGEANLRHINGRKRAYFDLLRQTLDELKTGGRLQDGVDTAVAAFSIIGMIMWIARWRKAEGRFSLEEVADQVVIMVQAGLLAE